MRRKAAIALALAAPLVLAAFALSLAGRSGGESTAGRPTEALGSAVVARRTLAERLTVAGTIGFAGEATALARLSGTITWLPAVGDVVRRGEALYEVAGQPVLLMYGEVPAYRSLREGISDGADVRQLEVNLAALGFEPGEVDATFTSATAAAVATWQESLGLEADGEVELGRVTFLPGPRRITGVEVTLGESIGSGGGGAPIDGAGSGGPGAVLAAYRPPGLDPGVEAPKPAPDEADLGPEAEAPGEAHEPPAPNGRPNAQGGVEEPRTSTPSATGPEGEGRGESSDDRGGGEEAGSLPVLKTSSTRRVVVAELEPDQQAAARRGQSVVVVLPDGTETRGTVRRLATVEGDGEEGAPGSEAEAGIEATIGLNGKKRVPALEGATVSVVFTQRVRKDVLSVPVTALLAIGGGRYAVVVIRGSASKRVGVDPGLSADGFVEVSGKGLREGMSVETGE